MWARSLALSSSSSPPTVRALAGAPRRAASKIAAASSSSKNRERISVRSSTDELPVGSRTELNDQCSEHDNPLPRDESARAAGRDYRARPLRARAVHAAVLAGIRCKNGIWPDGRGRAWLLRGDSRGGAASERRGRARRGSAAARGGPRRAPRHAGRAAPRHARNTAPPEFAAAGRGPGGRCDVRIAAALRALIEVWSVRLSAHPSVQMNWSSPAPGDLDCMLVPTACGRNQRSS
eukprot:7390180-Prymnesium_polylepis.1